MTECQMQIYLFDLLLILYNLQMTYMTCIITNIGMTKPFSKFKGQGTQGLVKHFKMYRKKTCPGAFWKPTCPDQPFNMCSMLR